MKKGFETLFEIGVVFNDCDCNSCDCNDCDCVSAPGDGCDCDSDR